MTDALHLAKRLIAEPSITPEDGQCQKILAERLSECGFSIEHMPFGKVNNFWATKGRGRPLLVFAGHTDVVPTGPLEKWTHNPFHPVEKEGRLYGRGGY